MLFVNGYSFVVSYATQQTCENDYVPPILVHINVAPCPGEHNHFECMENVSVSVLS